MDPNIGTVFVAQKGNSPMALNIQMERNSLWIIDSGASNHMTGNATLFIIIALVLEISWLELLMGLYLRWLEQDLLL